MIILIRIARQAWIRRLVIPTLSRANLGNIVVAHHWTGDNVYLHSFRHKGYWFYGKHREKNEMVSLKRLVRPSDTVFDIGAHIGYVALFFARLAPYGRVHSFEPGSNNLPYLRRNVASKPNITVVESAVGDQCGTALFGLEDLSGQNNSLDQSLEALRYTAAAAFVVPHIHREPVTVTTVDRYCMDTGVRPQLMKIDVEGSERDVLAGAERTLASARPILMVEVSQNPRDVMGLILAAGYEIYDSSLVPFRGVPDGNRNFFCVHQDQTRRVSVNEMGVVFQEGDSLTRTSS
jgi:FkbM family methyltransferase